MRVMITGARGLLGAAVTREFAPAGDVRALARADLDLTDAAAVFRAVEREAPEAIVNCAAFSGVDRAQDEADRALEVNAFAVLTLARAAAARGCALVHYSTDFVFDGESDRPYTEEDEPNPRNFYGLSKLLGEWLAAEHDRAWVLRVESLFGEPAPGAPPRGSLHAIVARIREGVEAPVFVDRVVSPAYTVDVARATRALLQSKAPPGVYHCANAGAARWVDVAREAARILGRPLKARELRLETAGLKAARPRYCALSSEKLAAAAGFVMPTWEDALRRYLGATGSDSGLPPAARD